MHVQPIVCMHMVLQVQRRFMMWHQAIFHNIHKMFYEEIIYNFKSETSFGGKGKPSINEVSLFYLKGLRIFEFSELYKCFLVIYESTYATLDPVLWSIIDEVVIFYLISSILMC